jgi:putative transposase
MPRGPRLIIPEVAVHIVQRGHDRRDCFREDTDYLVYLANLNELAGKVGCAVHAYCLMTNHIHMLLTPSQAHSCARLMRNLGQRYVQYFNRRYERSGTLWEGRFWSCLVDSASYVVGCYRYIERNPVRAGMVPMPHSYRWSSYSGNAGLVANQLLAHHAEYLALSEDETARHAAYRLMLSEEDDPVFLTAIRDATNGGFGMISEALKSRLPPDAQARVERKPSGPRPVARPEDGLAQLELELGLRPRRS